MRLPALCLAVAALAWSETAGAQAPTALSFEVASVKPSAPGTGDFASSIPRILPVNGRLTAVNVPLRFLIRLAYGLQDFQLTGGPSELLSSKFDITAKAEHDTAPANDLLAMLRSLLVERFKLKTHTESREMPIYALVLARADRKLGPDLKPSTSDCAGKEQETAKRLEALAKDPAAAASLLTGPPIPCTMMPMASGPGNFGLRGNGQPMAALLRLLTPVIGRTVVDKTALTGLFDFELKFDPEVMLRLASQAGLNIPVSAANLPPSDSPALLTAIQEQLGLKLDSQRGPVDITIIDSVSAPTPD